MDGSAATRAGLAGVSGSGTAGSTGHIHYEVDEGIATITIDRPSKRNAMTWAVLEDFLATVGRAGQDDRVRVVVLTGAGGAFCAGTDLSDLSGTPAGQRGGSGRRDGPAWPLVACPRPVLAAVDGPARFASRVVEPEDLGNAAREEARRYLAGSPFAIAHVKQLVYGGLERSVAEHLAAHRDALEACFASEDHQEGVASFLERRPPRFVGR